MRVLLTGSSGWLGRFLAPRLRLAGHAVTGLDVAPAGDTDIVGSVADRALVDHIFAERGIAAVIHAGALHKPDIARYPAQAFVDVNMTGTLNLLEAAVAFGASRFVFTSTTSLMISTAIREGGGDTAVWIDETLAPLEPRNIYGVTKLAAERLCRLAHIDHRLPVVILRTSRFFPEDDDTHAVPSGENLKANELLHRRLTVEDAAAVHLAALDRAPAIGFGTFIVSAATPFARADAAQLKRDAPSVIARYFPDAAALYAKAGWTLPASIDRVYDASHAERILDFRCAMGFAEMLAALRERRPLPVAHDPTYTSPIVRRYNRPGFVPPRAPPYSAPIMKPPPQKLPRTFAVKSFGCQMNVYDGDLMAELMAAQGLTPADAADADLVVLNTCHIREKAAEKVYSDIGRIRKTAGKQGRAPMIAIAGCVAQAEGAEIVRRARVDIVVGPQAYHNLPDLVAKAARGESALDTDMPVDMKFGHLPARRRVPPSAFLTVQEGCDKFCTYCVVPYTRGAEVSRPWRAIVDEANALVDAGAREITLLGQNVNAWVDGEHGLEHLIAELDRIPGLARIRYTTSHPNDMTQGLIDAHRDVQKLMPFLHLPVQSGSGRILKAMNRSHDRDSYLHILDRVRAARPDIALSGDFIVGFPGETEADFAETLSLVDAAGYAQAFSFKYSPRPGTPAAALPDQIAPEVMDDRLQRLQGALNRDQAAFNAATLGRTCQVLIERKGKLPGQMLGKSPWLQSVHLLTDAAIGDLVDVEIVRADPHSLSGAERVRAAA